MPKKPIRRPGYSQEHSSWFIRLTQDVIALVDPDMVPILSQENWYASENGHNWVATRKERLLSLGRRQVTVNMHRLIMDMPKDKEIDHIEHPPFEDRVIDNRRTNLRICTRSENGKNTRSMIGSSRYKGVSWRTRENVWIAHITTDGRSIYLGRFGEEKEAAKAYDAAAIKLHGEYALLNLG